MKSLLEMSGSCAQLITSTKLEDYPFRHLTIDGFLDDSTLQQGVREALNLDIRLNYGVAKDKRCEFRKLAFFPHVVGSVFNQIAINLCSPQVVNAIGEKFGYKGLVPDPTYYGGGLHMTMPGGFLGIHRDFNIHHELNLKRVANLIVFLNNDWLDEYGGHLFLQGKPRDCEKTSILPVFNRAIIFDTAADNSYHGQPEPLKSPLGQNRLSLALYYYQSLPSHPIQERGTDFVQLRAH